MWIGNGSGGHGVYLFDLQTFEAVIISNTGTEYAGGIDGNWIVWSKINLETGKSGTYICDLSNSENGKSKTYAMIHPCTEPQEIYTAESQEERECKNKMQDKGELQRVLLSKKESISAMINILTWWNSLLNEWFTISDILSAKINVIFYGDYTIWSDDRNGNFDIYGFNLETKEEFLISNALEDQSLSTYNSGNNFIVWTDWRNVGEENPDNSDIYGYNFGTQEEFIVTNTLSEEREVVAYGSKVAWIEKGKIVDEGGNIIGWADKIKVKDLNTGEISTIQDTSTYKKSLRMNDEFIIWVNSSDVNVSLDSLDIHGYCLTNGVAFTVCTEDKGQLDPELLGNRVIWQDMRNDENDIYCATLEIIQ